MSTLRGHRICKIENCLRCLLTPKVGPQDVACDLGCGLGGFCLEAAKLGCQGQMPRALVQALIPLAHENLPLVIAGCLIWPEAVAPKLVGRWAGDCGAAICSFHLRLRCAMSCRTICASRSQTPLSMACLGRDLAVVFAHTGSKPRYIIDHRTK